MLNNKWKYHTILWAIVILLGYITDFGTGGIEALKYSFTAKGIRLDVVFYSASIFIYFINYKYVCPRFLSKKKSHFFALFFLGLIVLFALIRYGLDEVIIKEITGENNYRGEALKFKYYFFDNFHYAIRPILYSTIIFYVFRSIKTQQEIFQLQIHHKKAELSFLKSQISPHFLFNTLNSFYSELMDKQPDTAKDVLKLSEMLRYVTYNSKQEFIPLEKELKFVEDYIHFHKKRFENELYISFKVIGEVSDQKIASLVLMHFVENVFKHGVLNDENKEATIEIKISNNELSIITNNTFDLTVNYTDSGIGVENLKRRLNAIYGDNYKLNYVANKSNYTAFLKLPI